MTPQEQYIAVAHSLAQKYGLDPALVCAVVEQESSWQQWAIRFEPAFRERYVEALGLPATEEIARSISWGLMQVMGQVAREHGFTGDMASLCEPLNGLEIGCKVLTAKLAAAHGVVRDGLQLWNGGANLAYAAQVLARMDKYKLPLAAQGRIDEMTDPHSATPEKCPHSHLPIHLLKKIGHAVEKVGGEVVETALTVALNGLGSMD